MIDQVMEACCRFTEKLLKEAIVCDNDVSYNKVNGLYELVRHNEILNALQAIRCPVRAPGL